MKIGINLLYLIPGVVGGTETYAFGLLNGLAKVATGHDFIVFVNQNAAKWPLPTESNFTRVVCSVSGARRSHRYGFEQCIFPTLLRQKQVDLVHSLGYVGPIHTPCPHVLTVPDTNFVDLAETMSIQRRTSLRWTSTLAAKNCRSVITISEFSKKRLCLNMNLPSSKVRVTHLAQHVETSALSEVEWNAMKLLYGIQEPYVVAFGGGAIHKNIMRLLRADDMANQQMPHNLVLIGHLPPGIDESIFLQSSQDSGRIVTTGYVPRDHIHPLLSHAELFVLPSLYEGFGLPVLEAQHAGVPVACSTAGSLPEVAGEGANFFDPESVDAIAASIIQCLSNTDYREMLRLSGQKNAQRFSWGRTAEKTLKVYESASSGEVPYV